MPMIQIMKALQIGNMMKLSPHLKGFTLFETLIGLSIISILSIYAIPNYLSFKQSKTMSQELNRLVRTINYARNQSINMSQHVILCASNSLNACDGESQWHQGWLVFADTNRNKQFDSNDLLLLTEQKMQPGLNAVSSKYRNLIRFDQTGFSPGTNLSIRFCDQRGSTSGKAIIVSNVGRPRLNQQINTCG